jgi:putative restriction endonuclease
MRYWWVNQNQTFRQEFHGGYLWSPKRKSNQSINPFYEFMREVAPGDIIFCFEGARIRALGIAQSTCYEAPKPEEFGAAGINWNDIGWKVEVRYFLMHTQIRPAEHMAMLGPWLPERYSPLQSSGRGNQSVYLTTVPEPLATALIGLIGRQARDLLQKSFIQDYSSPDTAVPDILRWEDHIANRIAATGDLAETQRDALIMARRGQGIFKANVRRVERRCRVTGVDRTEHLIASHTKPWRDCASNEERLDGENGLLLTPNIDHLFDRGFISFEDSGRLLVSAVADKESLRKMGVPVDEVRNVGGFTDGQKHYLDFHRESVFLAANLRR